MNKFLNLYLLGTLLFLAGCRNEEGLFEQERNAYSEAEAGKFSVFTAKSKDGKINYTKGFKDLALTYDSIYKQDYTGRKELAIFFLNKNRTLQNIPEHIDFSIHSQLIEEENGNKWMVFPKIKGTRVVGLVLSALVKDEKEVYFGEISKDNNFYKENISKFQEKYLLRGQLQRMPERDIDEVVIVKPRGLGLSLKIDFSMSFSLEDDTGNTGGDLIEMFRGNCSFFRRCEDNKKDDGGMGGSSPDINNFRISPEDAKKYPKLDNLLKNVKNYVTKNAKVKSTLMKYTSLSEDELLNKLEYGNGPRVEVVELKDAYGYHNAFTNKVQIDKGYVSKLESAKGDSQEVMALFLSITLLHEFVHWTDGVFYNYLHENGEKWEKETYGFIVDLNNIKLIKK